MRYPLVELPPLSVSPIGGKHTSTARTQAGSAKSVAHASAVEEIASGGSGGGGVEVLHMEGSTTGASSVQMNGGMHEMEDGCHKRSCHMQA